MRGSVFTIDERSVSEIYGTLLIISVVLITALVIVGLGTFAIQEITSSSNDDLARQSVIEIDNNIDQLTEGDIDQSTTISVPDGTGADFTMQNETVFVVNVTTHTSDWTSTDPDGALVDSDKQVNRTKLHVGSIVHEADDGSQVVYQGGAVWEIRDGNIKMVNAPDMDIIDNSLKLSLVDVTDMNLVQEGGELTIRRDAAGSQQTTNSILETIYTQMKKNGDMEARAKVNITVQGPYARGWAEYAKHGMTEGATVYPDPDAVDADQYTIQFGMFGNNVTNISADFGDGVIFSEPSEYAPIKHNDSAGDVTELSPGASPSDDTRNYEVVPDSGDYELGIRYDHNDSGYAWWVWNESADKWENIENNSMAMKDTSNISVVEEDPDSLSSGQFHIQNGTWTCAVNDGSTDSTDVFHEYVDEADKGCLKNPVDIENPEDHVADLDPQYEIVDSSVDYIKVNNTGYTWSLSNGDQVAQGLEHVNLSFQVTNTGYGTAEQPIAVVANQSEKLGEDYWLYDGQENVKISPGDTESFEFEFNTTGIRAGDYNLSAGTPDDGIGKSNSTWFEVQYSTSDANFEVVNIVDVDDGVTAGDPDDPVEITANITNTGKDGSQTVTLKIDGDVRVYKEVDIDAGDSKEVTFEWHTQPSDAGDRTANVTTFDDFEETYPVEVKSPSGPDTDFEIQAVSGDSVDEGNTATLNVSIKNNGSEDGVQHVVLRNPDTGRTVGQDVDIDSGDTEWVEFDWGTEVGDEGDYTLRFETYDESETVALNVTRDKIDADFELDVVSVDRLVTAGGTVTIQLRVKNNGTETDTRDVWLRDFDGDIVDIREDVTLDGGDSTSVFNFTWRTKAEDSEGGMPQNVTLGITRGGETAEEPVTVQDPSADDPVFEVMSVTNLNATESDPILEGQNLTFDAQIRNTGGQPDEQSVVLLDFEGNPVVVKQDVRINASETKTVSFTWETVVGDAGNGTLNVTTADDVAEFNASIETLGPQRNPVDVVFALDETGSMNTNDPDGKRIDATKTAIGGLNQTAGDRAAVLEFSQDTKWVSCGFLCWTEVADGPPYNIYQPLSNDLDAVNSSLRTNPGGQTDIAGAIDGAVEALNNAPNPQKQVIVILSDGQDNWGDDPVDRAKDVDENITIYTVGFGNADEQQLKDIANQGSGEGEYFAADNASELADKFRKIVENITAPETPEFEVESLTPNDPIEGGEKLEVTATIRNNGTVGGEQAVTLTDFDGNFVDSEIRNLSAGETTNVTLTLDTSGEVDWEAKSGSVTESISVVTPVDTSTTSVTLVEPTVPNFEFDGVNVIKSPINETERLEVEAEVTNTGDAAGTQTLTLVDNETGDPLNGSVSVTLAPNETAFVTVSYVTEIGDRDIDEVALVSEDDRQAESVQILAGDGTGDTEFEVKEIKPQDDSVVEGDKVTVIANISNPGDVRSSDYITLERPDGTIVDSKLVEIDPNDYNDTVALTWHTQPGDGGTPYPTIVVNTTGPGQNSTDVELESLSDPDVEFKFDDIDPQDSGVEVGDDLTVEVTVNNTGSEAGNRTIALKDPDTGNPIDTVEVTNLAPGPSNTKTVTLTWEDVPNINEVDVAIALDSKEETRSVSIDAPDASTDITFSIDSVGPSNATSPDDPPTAGKTTLEIDVSVQNDFGQPVYVELHTPYGGPIDVQKVSDGYDSTGSDPLVTLRWNTHPAHGAEGSQAVTVKIRGETDSEPIFLARPELPRPGGPGIGGDDDGVDIDVDEITIGS